MGEIFSSVLKIPKKANQSRLKKSNSVASASPDSVKELNKIGAENDKTKDTAKGGDDFTEQRKRALSLEKHNRQFDANFPPAPRRYTDKLPTLVR